MKSVVLLSGGLDSAVCAALELESGRMVLPVWFEYGQLHRKQELAAARKVALDLGLLAPIETTLPRMYGGITYGVQSQLTGSGAIVKVRNLVFCSIAASMAASRWSAGRVVLGANASDCGVFPDCRLEFIESLNETLRLDGNGVQIHAPLILLTKAQIVAEARRLQVPIELTWSCYAGGETPCRECGACVEREKALA